MIYASPVPTEYASGQYYDQTGADYYLSPAKLEGDYAPVRFERELGIFRAYCQHGAVLDVGCSSGAFLYQLKERFAGSYEGIGTDASGPALDYARSRGINVVRGDFLEQNFEGRKFEAITLWAVLEHLAKPRAFVEKASSLLKTGGHCFVLVPNTESLAARVLGMRYRYIYPQHLNYFTRKTLSRLVSDHFTIVQKGSSHFNPIILLQDWKGGSREVSNAERGALLQRTTAYKQRPLFRPLRTLYRLSEKALASCNLADNLFFVLRGRDRIREQ
jgi:2-polyprenyl-3-methyl-5-hydroxy-6-metoxy-1,4-benzoquinol methylase